MHTTAIHTRTRAVSTRTTCCSIAVFEGVCGVSDRVCARERERDRRPVPYFFACVFALCESVCAHLRLLLASHKPYTPQILFECLYCCAYHVHNSHPFSLSVCHVLHVYVCCMGVCMHAAAVSALLSAAPGTDTATLFLFPATLTAGVKAGTSDRRILV